MIVLGWTTRREGQCLLCLSLSALLLAACASRAPVSYPANAASSPQAPEAKLSDVTLALSSEPPLPSQPIGAWQGLREPDASSQAVQIQAQDAPAQPMDHAEHGGHHHHGAH